MRAARVDANQKAIVNALRACGCSVYVLGLPLDLLVGRAGQNYLLEVKTGKGAKFTKFQEEFRATWQGHWARVETVEQALEVVGLNRVKA